jgi:hypothetical protein
MEPQKPIVSRQPPWRAKSKRLQASTWPLTGLRDDERISNRGTIASLRPAGGTWRCEAAMVHGAPVHARYDNSVDIL